MWGYGGSLHSDQCVLHGGMRHEFWPMRPNSETVHSDQCVLHSCLRHEFWPMRPNIIVQSNQCVLHGGMRHDEWLRPNSETVHSNECVLHSCLRHEFWPMRPNTGNVPAGERPVPRRWDVQPEHRGMFSRPSQERDTVRQRGRGPMLPGWGLQLPSLMATCEQKSGPPEVRSVLVSG
jgi:hypothetical protein